MSKNEDIFISFGLENIIDLLISLDLVKTPLMDSVLNINEEEAQKTAEKRNFHIVKLERIEELARKVRGFMIYFNAEDFCELSGKIMNEYFFERFKDLKTIDYNNENKEIFKEWVSEQDKITFSELEREWRRLNNWLERGHPDYKWRKDLQKQHNKEVIEIKEEPEEVNQVNQENKNQTEIKPIETEYKGYRFRSRLEARWAVFFEACGVDWEYEPEGYELGDGQRYLPDFVIHNVGIERSEDEGKLYDVYVEVKGEKPKEKDIKRFYAFSGVDSTSNEKNCPKPLLVVSKIPEDLFEQFIISHYSGNPIKEESDYLFHSMRFIKNNFNSQRTAIFIYKEGKLLIRSYDDPCYLEDIGKEDRNFTDNAFKKARSARFEFGEKPE